MSRRLITTAAIAAAALLAPGAAQAQNPFKIGLAVGPSIPTGDFADALEWGYNVTGSLSGRPMMSPVGIRIEGMYQNLTGKDQTVGTVTVEAADLRTFAGIASVELGLPTMGVSPYLIGGLGYYNNKSEGEGEKSTSDLGFNLGAGLSFNLAGFSTFAEARFHQVMSKDDEVANSANLRFVPITFGIKF